MTNAAASTKNKLGFLSDMEIFQDLSPKEMEELDRLITLSAVKKGKVFYRPRKRARCCLSSKRAAFSSIASHPRARSW